VCWTLADNISVWNAVFGAQGLNGYPLEVSTNISL
jgi:hypothetical protein